ncbi:MAG: SAM-dependent methyltransferase, partial [Clostridia bacterium]|nr:SAM-dependent methyltransferase [Clostridia bacterium]
MSILEKVIESTYKYIEKMPKEQRKQYGQFFTGKETAKFMAELLTIPENTDNISILDPGAGSGILSAALIERLLTCNGIKSIHLTCYETDNNIIAVAYRHL